MAYVTPTAATFKARFPEFAAVSDALIDLIIAEIEPQIDESWQETDRAPAIMYRVAHILARGGYLTGDTGSSVTGPMKRRTVGDVTVEFAGISTSNGGSGSAAFYGTTPYGQEYWLILQRNHSGWFVV